MNAPADLQPEAVLDDIEASEPTADASASRHHPAARHLPSQRDPSKRRHWQNQYLPTLFDRLCDDEPHKRHEAPESYAATRSQLRGIVQRDLAFLLNSTNHDDWLDEDHHAHAASSTVNYGLPALAGGYLSERRWADIEKMIRRAIADFEPRLLPGSVMVKPMRPGQGEATYNILQFEISAMLHMEPYPVEFTVQSAVDLETNRISILRS
jgi:type VI secretion system protein ImpF